MIKVHIIGKAKRDLILNLGKNHFGNMKTVIEDAKIRHKICTIEEGKQTFKMGTLRKKTENKTVYNVKEYYIINKLYMALVFKELKTRN